MGCFKQGISDSDKPETEAGAGQVVGMWPLPWMKLGDSKAILVLVFFCSICWADCQFCDLGSLSSYMRLILCPSVPRWDVGLENGYCLTRLIVLDGEGLN